MKKRTVADVNGAIADAEKNLMQARGALGRGGDGAKGEAIDRLERALNTIARSLKAVEGGLEQ
jgi:hypothetical protein